MRGEVDALCDCVGILHHGKLEKTGTPAELKAEIGPDATLDDVFERIVGKDSERGNDYYDIRQARRSVTAHE